MSRGVLLSVADREEIFRGIAAGPRQNRWWVTCPGVFGCDAPVLG